MIFPKDMVVGSGIVVVDNIEYPYLVISTAFARHLPFFAGAPNKESLFISEEVPVKFRNFVLTHEVMCQLVAPKDNQGPHTCRSATERELAMVSKDEMGAYVLMRLVFYNRLIDTCCASDATGGPNNAPLVAKLRASKALLETRL